MFRKFIVVNLDPHRISHAGSPFQAFLHPPLVHEVQQETYSDCEGYPADDSHDSIIFPRRLIDAFASACRK